LLIIAHDAKFLDSVTDTIVLLENKKLESYSGNYSDFIRMQAEAKVLQTKRNKQLSAQREHLQKYIDRFRYKPSKAKQAQSRIKALARMETIAKVHDASSIGFNFKSSTNCPNPLLRLYKAAVGYEQIPILENLNLLIAPGDRIGLLGLNGAGKSTLLKLLARELAPLSGDVTFGEKLKIGYFAQHQVEALPMDDSAAEYFASLAPNLREQAIRQFLGQFGFSDDSVFTKINDLSGGEKARLALAKIIWLEPHILILDEPTNHLDLATRENLGLALQSFAGALIIISHDRQLLSEITDSLYLVDAGTMQPFDGDIDDYCSWVLSNKSNKSAKTVNTTKSIAAKPENQLDRKQLRVMQNKIKKLDSL